MISRFWIFAWSPFNHTHDTPLERDETGGMDDFIGHENTLLDAQSFIDEEVKGVYAAYHVLDSHLMEVFSDNGMERLH